jgi:hypothetical protein
VTLSGGGGAPVCAFWDGHTISVLAVTAGRWYHLAGVLDWTSMRLYIDGILAATGTASGTPLPALPTKPLRIGAGGDGAAEDPMYGAIDDIRIYPRALSAAEVAREFADPWWRLTGGRGRCCSRPEYANCTAFLIAKLLGRAD